MPLTSLPPTHAVCQNKPLELLPGKLTNGNSLTVQGWQFEEGYGVPSRSEITYEIDPSWQTFVAVIGLADGKLEAAGPYQILLDGELHWASKMPFTRSDRGEQISVSIPPGHKTITLKLLGNNSFGAWAQAGFLER